MDSRFGSTGCLLPGVSSMQQVWDTTMHWWLNGRFPLQGKLSSFMTLPKRQQSQHVCQNRTRQYKNKTFYLRAEITGATYRNIADQLDYLFDLRQDFRSFLVFLNTLIAGLVYWTLPSHWRVKVVTKSHTLTPKGQLGCTNNTGGPIENPRMVKENMQVHIKSL